MTEENQQKQPTSPNEQEGSPAAYRVKLYQLNQDTNWEDKGTGFCVYQVGKDGEPDQLIVHAEEKENSILLSSVVEKRRLYQRQQDTLIVWTESDSRDLALSFQDPAGCEEVWQYIGKGQDGGRSNITGDDDSEVTPPARQSPEMTSLPDPELSNLKEIADIFTAAHTLNEKDKISTFITIENYFDKILPMFETCEDLEDITDLHLLYKVIIGLLALNDQGLIEQLLRDEYIIGFMGILEYNPNTPGMKAKHREFIKSHGNAKQVVDLADESIKRKIDQTFRLEYLQGILQSGGDADEGLLGVLNNMIFQNHADIVNHIQNNHIFLGELFQIVRNKDTTEEKRNETIRFVHQLCALTKQMQNSVRVSLYRSLADYGLFDMMHFALVDKERSIRIASLNILAAFTDLDVNCVRSHLLLQSKDERTTPLISTIVEEFASDTHHDLKVQYFEILRLLLDPNGNAPGGPMMSDPLKQAPETDEFLQLFYDKYVKILLSPIEKLDTKPITLKGPIEPLVLTQNQAQLCLYICEFLYFAIRNHGFRSKYILLSSDIFIKVMQLYRSKYAYIKLGGLRFFRVCVSICDEFYNRSLIKNNIFEATIRVLLDTKGQDCLLNSACLDLLEFIRKENIKMLVNHLVTQFGTVLDTITYITTCQQLREKHKENMNTAASGDDKMDQEAVSSDKTEKKDNHDGWASSTVDYDEEEYFNGSDEEDTSSATQIPPKSDTAKVKTPLVNYEDDEDEDEDLSAKEKPTEGKEKEKSEPMAIEESSNTSLKRKHRDEDQEAKDLEQDTTEANATKEKEGSLSPPPFKSRRRSIDDDEEEDVLAKRSALSPSSSPRQSPLAKKIVIKTSTIEKMRSQ
ncbi:component of IIS longevity pathway SMK-1-domain-containing protein [Mucor lusitanicus]|uniref:Component of IIS longevity pathway SMK-1-domain-containing protein n=1 Tax=Mucor circinelloides f. lusitanicus TaxID=29924 RepID=A0A8H4BBS4_MUCCL|nr:component of IIS longevity pathway SMK-1-domain-containing protein [Mucor lusitanicus]